MVKHSHAQMNAFAFAQYAAKPTRLPCASGRNWTIADRVVCVGVFAPESIT